MKFNYLKDKEGTQIGLKSFEDCVYDSKGVSLIDKINSINVKIAYIQSSMATINARLEPLIPPKSELEIALENVIKREDSNANICLLSDNNGEISSEYGYDYGILAGLLYTGEFSEYIKDGDWIELSTPDGGTYTMYANVDTYYGVSDDDGNTIGHHIDFISKELIYKSSSRVNGNNKYTGTDVGAWRMNADYTHTSYGSNNGISTETSPFLANINTQRIGYGGGIIDKLDAYYSDNISDVLKSYVVKKYHKVPTRYNTKALTDDNGSKWAELPYLWLPYEWEVWGSRKNATVGSESHMKQYHSFSNITDFRIKGDKNDPYTESWNWWNASAASGDSYSFSYVQSNGTDNCTGGFSWTIGAPLCFRFGARLYTDKPIIRDDTRANICLLTDNNGTVTSGYNYTYDFLADVLDSGEYSDYIKDGDWIELTTADGATYRMYANVDTYYGEGEDDDHKIGHHIDFISKELIYGSVASNSGSTFSSTNINSWRMNYDTTYNDNGNNNGVATEASPFLANNTVHRGSEGGIIDRLDEYYNSNISAVLKRHIVKKYHNIPTRYDSSGGKVADTGSKWAELPYLWIPYYKEVWGDTDNSGSMPTTTYESHMKQYHSFSSKSDFKVKGDKKNTNTTFDSWWTASARSGTNYHFCSVGYTGGASSTFAYEWYLGAPLCFRFMKTTPPETDEPTGDPLQEALKNVTLRSDANANICLLSDNNGEVTSEYGYDYDILSGLLYTGEYSDYIKDGDWIELSTPDGGTYNMYANVDTYYGEGEEGKEIGHHIDFISDNLIYGSTSRENGGTIYTASDINSWRMNKDGAFGSNNGVSTETSPFLANSTEHRGANGGIIDKLDAYYNDNISDILKSHIVKKYHNVPTRYSTSTLTDDNGSKWAELPYLWIPYYKEIWGDITNTYMSTTTYESHMKQYHSFSSISRFILKGDKKDTSTSWNWWIASAASGASLHFCRIDSSGKAGNTGASEWDNGVPLCFRFGSKPYPEPVKDPLEEALENVTLRSDSSANICLLSDNNGEISSDYGYTYDYLSTILKSGEYSDYIKNGDWIKLTTPDGGTYKMYANVDTYYGEGEEGKEIGHHIDFISDNLIYGCVGNNGSYNYSSTNINSWRMNYDTTLNANGSNNGVATESSPFLANSTVHRGAQGGIIDKLDAYYSTNISEPLKSHIVKKYHKVPTRYQSGTSLTNDNGIKWAEMPYLWIPYEWEILGSRRYATNGYESHMKQYHSFSSKGESFRKKYDKRFSTSSTAIWWTASARSGYAYVFCTVDASGAANYDNVYSYKIGAPLCFRFQ